MKRLLFATLLGAALAGAAQPALAEKADRVEKAGVPQGRINTAGYLRGMVEQCNSELNLQLFPEEVTAIAAVLNRDHYRFK